jgi:pilus assembly protein CpaB
MKSSVVMAIALIIGAVVSFFVAKSMGIIAPKSVNAAVVVAAKNIVAGEVINTQQLSLMPWHGEQLPAFALSNVKALAGRVARTPIYEGEMVIESKLAPADAVGGLASTISVGKRAITVRVNDVIAVAGFTFPGSFVDVLVNAKDTDNQPFSRIVLHRVKVLAVEQDTQADVNKPKVVNAVTLELTPDEVQKLDLARNIGVLTLVLRNEIDHEVNLSSVATLDDIILTPSKLVPATTAVSAKPKSTVATKKPGKTGPAINKSSADSTIEMRGIREYENKVL